MTEPQQEQTSVPFEPYAQALSAQRNQALDQVAQLQAINYELTAEIARLRGDTATVPGQVSDAGSPSSAPAASPK